MEPSGQIGGWPATAALDLVLRQPAPAQPEAGAASAAWLGERVLARRQPAPFTLPTAPAITPLAAQGARRRPEAGPAPAPPQAVATAGWGPAQEWSEMRYSPEEPGAIQRRPAEDQRPAEVSAVPAWAEPDLPLAAQPGAPAESVQRRMVAADAAQVAPGPTSMRSTPEASPPAEPDLDELARQVLPIVKRMLAVERERWAGR